MRHLRVLAVTPDFPPAPGGIQVLAHRILWHARQVRARVVTLGAPGADAFDADQPFEVRRLRWARANHRLAIALLNLKAVREGLRFRPQVALSFHIVMSPATWVLAKALRIPVALYVHADEARARHTEEIALRAGADRDRVHRISPGVDVPGSRSAGRTGGPTVVTVARLEDRYKGHDVMMRALPLIRRRVSNALWVIVGDGSLRPELEQLARQHGVEDGVRFVGQVSDAERDEWLDRADVFAMPSRLPERGGGGEGFGIAFIEASAHGLPVVAGGVAGAVDAVIDGETGLLVDPTSPKAVADAVASLLLDRERAAALGRAGKEHARRFEWPLVAEQLETLILELARGRPEAPPPA
jgi:phosphatidylinositol alpha-1,6-mannosyltransferase